MKIRIKLLVGTMAFLMMCGAALAASTTRFAVQDGTDADKFVVHDNGFVGVGTTTPSSPINIVSTAGFPGNAIKVEGNVAGPTGGGGIVAYNNRPSNALPLAGDRFGFAYFGSAVGGHPAGFEAAAEGDFTASSRPTFFAFATTAAGTTARLERLRITAAGNIGIGTATPKSKLHVVGLPVYADNAAANTGGLTAGAFYRTGGDPDQLCVVH